MSLEKRDGDPTLHAVPKDIFGLDEIIEHVVDPAADHVFDECDALVKFHVVSNPELKQQYLDDQTLILPAVTINGKQKTYQLTRTVDDIGTTFTYNRVGPEYSKAGFRLTRAHVGGTFLAPLDSTVDEKIVLNPDAINEARKRITKYAAKLGARDGDLANARNTEILPDTRAKKGITATLRALAWPFTSPYYENAKGVMYWSKFGHGTKVEKIPGARHISFARLAILALVIPTPSSFASEIEAAGFSVPKPLTIEVVDDVINQSEHRRQGFDNSDVEIPIANATFVRQQESVTLAETPRLPSSLAEQLADAPTLDADSPDTQDLYGGPRRLTNLGIIQGTGDDTDLEAEYCEDANVHLNGEDQLSVTNIGPVLANRLSFELLKDQIRVCNVSGNDIDEEYLENIYVQVVDQE